ncbi:MAG: hypothetical protein AB7F86_11915 [Bdellovibrionales bacterium]
MKFFPKISALKNLTLAGLMVLSVTAWSQKSADTSQEAIEKFEELRQGQNINAQLLNALIEELEQENYRLLYNTGAGFFEPKIFTQFSKLEPSCKINDQSVVCEIETFSLSLTYSPKDLDQLKFEELISVGIHGRLMRDPISKKLLLQTIDKVTYLPFDGFGMGGSSTSGGR